MNDRPSVFLYYPCAPVIRFGTVEEMSNPHAFFACRSVAGNLYVQLAAERSAGKRESELPGPKARCIQWQQFLNLMCQTHHLSSVKQLLEQAEQFKDNYDHDNYSDNIEDVSVHAGSIPTSVYARGL
jgi:hypothetical protein